MMTTCWVAMNWTLAHRRHGGVMIPPEPRTFQVDGKLVSFMGLAAQAQQDVAEQISCYDYIVCRHDSLQPTPPICPDHLHTVNCRGSAKSFRHPAKCQHQRFPHNFTQFIDTISLCKVIAGSLAKPSQLLERDTQASSFST